MTTNNEICTAFRKFLFNLAGEITNDQLQFLKFILKDRVGKAKLEQCSKPLELLETLEEQAIITKDNLSNLEQLFETTRNFYLKNLVLEYKSTCKGQNAHHINQTSLDTRQSSNTGRSLVYTRSNEAQNETCSQPNAHLLHQETVAKIVEETEHLHNSASRLPSCVSEDGHVTSPIVSLPSCVSEDGHVTSPIVSLPSCVSEDGHVTSPSDLHPGVGMSSQVCSGNDERRVLVYTRESESERKEFLKVTPSSGQDSFVNTTQVSQFHQQSAVNDGCDASDNQKCLVELHNSGNLSSEAKSLQDFGGLVARVKTERRKSLGSEANCQTLMDTGMLCEQKIELRSYQKQLGTAGLKGLNCIICAPTGSGKTFTAGYICMERRKEAKDKGERFKAIFIVCIRNLVLQQSNALKQIILDDISVVGVDDQLSLSSYLEKYDVAVATAQVLVNALKSGEMKITDIDLLMMDECHHTDLGHPYNAVMAAYHEIRLQNPSKKLPQIVGLTASLGVGDSQHKPIYHYVRICANLNCDRITHVQAETPSMAELLHHCPRLSQDEIKSVEPCDPNAPFVLVIISLMKDIELNELAGDRPPHCRGSQEYENWIIKIRIEADSAGSNDVAGAADTLKQINASLMIHYELRSKDAFAVLEDYMNDANSRVSPRVRDRYMAVQSQLKDIISSEPLHGNNAKVLMLCTLLKSLHEKFSDPRGIILTRTRLAVTKLVEFIKEDPEFSDIIYPEKLVGQGQRDGTMTDVQQKSVLRQFRLDKSDPSYCNLLVATDVAQEGLDMPKCNFVIRYNFVSNEIGSVQSKGRARAPNSECYLIVEKGSNNEKREIDNLRKERLMLKALDDIDRMPLSELKEDITKEQNAMIEQRKRDQEAKLKNSLQLQSDSITIHCLSCKEPLCQATEMRRNGNNFICVSETFARQVIFSPMSNPKEYRLDIHTGGTSCWSCKKSIGFKIMYKQGCRQFGYVLGKDNVMYRKNGETTYSAIKQWSKVPFRIEEDQ